MTAYNQAKKLISSAIPVFRKFGYSDSEIKAGLEESIKLLKLSNLSEKTRNMLIKVIKEVKEEVR